MTWTWRVARSLTVLLDEVNAAAPHRSIVSDGTIGDASHASRSSDHNPWVRDRDGVGVVRARDITHDPLGGLDCHRLAADLVPLLGVHSALLSGAYVIWNRRIISANRLAEGWRPYIGANGHTKHLHVSVALNQLGYDNTRPWRVLQEEDMLRPEDKQWLIGLIDEKAEQIARQTVHELLTRDLYDDQRTLTVANALKRAAKMVRTPRRTGP